MNSLHRLVPDRLARAADSSTRAVERNISVPILFRRLSPPLKLLRSPAARAERSCCNISAATAAEKRRSIEFLCVMHPFHLASIYECRTRVDTVLLCRLCDWCLWTVGLIPTADAVTCGRWDRGKLMTLQRKSANVFCLQTVNPTLQYVLRITILLLYSASSLRQRRKAEKPQNALWMLGCGLI